MNIANWYEGEPVTDVRMNQMVNDINSLVAGSVGLAVLTVSGTWTVPAGITADTRLRVWVAGGGAYATSGGSGENTYIIPGLHAKWAYSIFTGFSAGQSVAIAIGGPDVRSTFNTVSLYSDGATAGGIGGTAPAGVLWSGPKLLSHGQGDPNGLSTPGSGAIVVEW